MASKSDSLVPVLLLGGLAIFLMYQRGMLGGVTGPAPTAAQIRTGATDKINAVGNALGSLFTYLGGVTNDGNHSSARPTEAALDQVIEAAKEWQRAYGGIAGADGDPYGDFE